jgi:DNA-binding transcriptional LysR family regulator
MAASSASVARTAKGAIRTASSTAGRMAAASVMHGAWDVSKNDLPVGCGGRLWQVKLNLSVPIQKENRSIERMLRFLPSFLAVVETGSAAAAAERLHKTAAALSYDLRQLHALAGEPLFGRLGRGLQLTQAGTRFAAAARQALDLLARSADPAQPVAATPLRVAAVSGFGRYVLLPALFAVAGERPIELAFLRNEDVARRVREGQADLGFCFTRVRSASLRFAAIYEEQLALIAPPSWRVPKASAALAAWCREHPSVTYEESDFVFAHWHAHTLAGARHRLNQGDHYSELEEAVAAVSAGRGYSIVPVETAERLSTLHPLQVLRARQAGNMLHSATRQGDEAMAVLLESLSMELKRPRRRGTAR